MPEPGMNYSPLLRVLFVDDEASVLDGLQRIEYWLVPYDEFDGNHFGRAGNAFAAGKLEKKAIGLERDHLAASSLFIS